MDGRKVAASYVLVVHGFSQAVSYRAPDTVEAAGLFRSES